MLSEWCNNNAGIIAAVQTIATVILSVFAIGVTVYFSRTQYKKALKIYSGLDYDEEGNYTIELHLINIGNVPLYIKGIEIVREYKNHTTDILALGSWHSSSSCDENFLISKMHKSFVIPLQHCNANIKEESKIKIIIDAEERTFIYRIGWAVG